MGCDETLIAKGNAWPFVKLQYMTRIKRRNFREDEYENSKKRAEKQINLTLITGLRVTQHAESVLACEFEPEPRLQFAPPLPL